MSRTPPAVGIVTALELERGWIGSAVMIEVAGMGRARAEAATTRLLDRGATAIVSWGIAGGLDPELEPGTVVIPGFVIDVDQGSRYADAGWRNRLLARIENLVPISVGPMFHADAVVSSPAGKRDLHRRWDVVAVDMESAGIARVAQEAGVPWVVVRVVGDVADQELPQVLTELSDENGRLRAGAVGGLVLRPRLWPALFALGRANAAAGRSMRRVWAAAGTDLALGGDRNP
jgi:adenosylhomocysteine nucleosidase